MLLLEDKEIDFFVASRIGSFKHVKYHTDTCKNNKKCIENLFDIKKLEKDDAILCMEWGDKDQKEIILAKKNRKIEIYNTETGLTKSYTVTFGEGDIVGVARCSGGILTGVASGMVQILKDEDIENPIVIHTGGKLDCVKVWEYGDVFATGGEENDLKVWKLGEEKPIFLAKNLPHDWLQLRRPIWVTDLVFLDEHLLAVCSRHGYIRLYDTKIQRRPISSIDTPNMAATCISRGFEQRQALVGFGRGHLHQVDFAKSRLDKGYKSAAGAITAVAVCEREGLIVSASLDRHLRVHERDSKSCVYKQYLTSKLTWVLVQSARNTPLTRVRAKEEGEREAEAVKLEHTDELDDIFDDMEVIGEKPKRKLTSDRTELEGKKICPSLEGSTADASEDAILKLLKSTEKTRRRREKNKREKKKRSLYHNA